MSQLLRELKSKIVCFKLAELVDEFQIWCLCQSTVDIDGGG